MSCKNTCCFECAYEIDKGDCLKAKGGCARESKDNCRGDDNACNCGSFRKKGGVK